MRAFVCAVLITCAAGIAPALAPIPRAPIIARARAHPPVLALGDGPVNGELQPGDGEPPPGDGDGELPGAARIGRALSSPSVEVLIATLVFIATSCYTLQTLPRAVRSLAALGYFERTLEAAGTGFLVADRPLLCDLGLFYVLYELAEDDNCGPGFAARFGVPLLGAFVERMAARPQIAAYLASPTRMPRYARASSGASTYEYVAGRLNPEIL